jgi:hypothetical protein
MTMNTYTITAGTTIIGRFPTEALALGRLEQLAGKSWEDLVCWHPDGAIAATLLDGQLIRPGSVTFTPAA